jgi:hypothetical protein
MYPFTNVSAGYDVSIEVVCGKIFYIVLLHDGNLLTFFIVESRHGDATRTQAGRCAWSAYRITCSGILNGRSNAMSD